MHGRGWKRKTIHIFDVGFLLRGCHIRISGARSARWFPLSLHNREELSIYHGVTKYQRVGKKRVAATQPLHSSHTYVSAGPVAKSHKSRNFSSSWNNSLALKGKETGWRLLTPVVYIQDDLLTLYSLGSIWPSNLKGELSITYCQLLESVISKMWAIDSWLVMCGWHSSILTAISAWALLKIHQIIS